MACSGRGVGADGQPAIASHVAGGESSATVTNAGYERALVDRSGINVGVAYPINVAAAVTVVDAGGSSGGDTYKRGNHDWYIIKSCTKIYCFSGRGNS